MKKISLTELKAPVVFRGWEELDFTGVQAELKEGKWHLLASAQNKDGEELVVESFSEDLIFWNILQRTDRKWQDVQLEGNKNLNQVLEQKGPMDSWLGTRPKELEGPIRGEGSVVYCQEGGLYFLFYCAQAGDREKRGNIGLAVSRDMEHWQTFCRDQATYPENGVVYEGDYYRAIPFSQYIFPENLPQGQENRIFDLRDFGGVGDGATLCTQAFQAAAWAIEANGGGILLVTGGFYCTGTVNIPSGCTLWIDRDSAICASKNLDLYRDALISCVGSKDVAIKGGGRIIGNGEYFVYLPLKPPLTSPLEETFLPPRLYDPMGYPVNTIRYAYRSRIRYAEDRYQEGLPPISRPMYTVWIRGCERVEISNIIIEDALDWTLVLDCSSQVKVENVVINGNRHVANTDGIDIMGCSQVEIKHCFVSCADDGICVKSPRKQGHDGINVADQDIAMRETKDVHISDCTVISVMNCFKIGTETYFDIEGITVENCRFMMPDIFPGAVSGISIESADGSHIRRVKVRNIQMNRVLCPVFICLNMRNKFGFEGPEDEAGRRFGGSIEEIEISHIRALNAEVPSIITGFMAEEEKVERRIEKLSIRDVKVVYRDNREVLTPQAPVYENLRDYPENNAFGDVPAYGFYIRHANQVVLENVEVIPRTMNTRPCILREFTD